MEYQTPLMTRARLAGALFLAPETMDELERLGLLPRPVARADDGEPLFHTGALLVVECVVRARDAGLDISGVRRLLAAYELLGTTTECWGERALIHALAVHAESGHPPVARPDDPASGRAGGLRGLPSRPGPSGRHGIVRH
ncbi:MAG: hypothetical protein ACQERG_05325 [Pseudomonadota bacterium]